MDTLDRFSLLIACPYCGQPPGVRCTTVRSYSDRPIGSRTTFIHAARSRPAWEGWRSGYLQGERHVVAMYDLTQERNTPEQRRWWNQFLARVREGSPV